MIIKMKVDSWAGFLSVNVLLYDYPFIDFPSFLLDGEIMTSKWQKFRLLMWKNYLLQWRHPFQTVLEIAIPVLFSALLVLIRSLVTPDIFPETFIFPAMKLDNITDTL